MASGPAERPRMAVEPETVALRTLQSALAEAQLALGRRMRMHPSDLAAMDHIAGAPGRIGPTDLAGRLGLSAPAATELVDRLEQAGHVLRERDPEDRRRVRLVPTASARDEVLGGLRGLLDALDAVAKDLPDEDRDAVRRYLDRAAEASRRFAADDPV
ncbi:MarR family winged helix-turn-helix transcriptional regulator [Amnibacterium sp.]|uniref:MarR family winged helix-turn-helix transcriptional regulator n=1 Tax=Amnibacterium sp. TaxID=1872496 RepID=UPI003F7B90FC